MQIVVNKCFGGFCLSNKAVKMYLELKGKRAFFYEQTKYGFKAGKNEYTKIKRDRNFLTHTITKDLGNKTNKLPNEHYFSGINIERTDPDLIKVVKKLGKKANGYCAELKIIKIPDNIKYEIDQYDGMESIHEEHRSW